LKILITGSQGMLGRDLTARFSRRHEVIPLSHSDADVTDAARIAEVIRRAAPGVVIHAAAFTAVDRCESERALAFQVNGEGTRNVAQACRGLSVPLAYLSSDYVFNGEKSEPYVETDAPDPLSVYGASKLEGENHVRALLDRYWIVRTSWLFGPHGKNFVEAILAQAKPGAALRVVSDQTGSPTYTEDLAAGLEAVIQRGAPGVYHISNQGSCSRFDFAREILRQAGLDPSRVIPVPASDLARPARRPRNSCLANTRLASEGIPLLPSWQDALHRYLLKLSAA
jgi:dTDP-4-dehydrorhamnose reductase